MTERERDMVYGWIKEERDIRDRALEKTREQRDGLLRGTWPGWLSHTYGWTMFVAGIVCGVLLW